MNRNILFIAYSLPPINSSASIRSANYIRCLSNLGWKVDVLTIHNPSHQLLDSSLMYMISNLPNIRIYRTYSGPIDSIALYGKRKIQYNNILRFTNKKPRGGSWALTNIVERVYKLICLPDRIIGWYPFALIKGMKLLRKNEYDLFLSLDPSLSVHLIAYALRKIKNTPWIMGINDPLSHNPAWEKQKSKVLLLQTLEKIILQNANAVITTTEETKGLYLRLYPFLNVSKIHAILGGYEPSDFDGLKKNKHNKFRIVYTGKIEVTRGSTRPFFQAIGKVAKESSLFAGKLEIVIIGEIDRSVNIEITDNLKKCITFVEPVDFRKSLEYTLSASVLLVWGNRGGLQIPLKIYYYLGAKRPLLVILGDEKDPLKTLLGNMNRGFVVNNNSLEIARALKKLYEFFKEENLEKRFVLGDVQEYTWNKLTTRLQNILLNVVG